MQGLILFAHGARDPRWSEPFAEVASRIASLRPDVTVRLAFLEFMSPTLAAAGAELAEAGCTSITVLPMFLGVGGHVRRDLPQMLGAMRAGLPNCQIEVAAAIGENSDVMQAMALAAAALLGQGASA
jgi:sirohydrochlorin cobaltochelatase